MSYAKNIIRRIDDMVSTLNKPSFKDKEIYLNQINELRRYIKNVSITRNDIDKKIIKEEWKSDGVLHRDDGPALVTYYDNGTVEREEFYKDGKLGRIESQFEPVLTTYHTNGNVHISCFINLPGDKYKLSCMEYDIGGIPKKEKYDSCGYWSS
jgi:hypothetical protein